MRGMCSAVVTGVVVMLLFVGGARAITCLECNTYFHGQRGPPCDSPTIGTDCVACMKVVTKVQMNDGWQIRKTMSKMTKYCARLADSPGLKREGCYYQLNNGGYTERCFCYTDKCNHGTTLYPTSAVWSYVAVLSLALCSVFLSR